VSVADCAVKRIINFTQNLVSDEHSGVTRTCASEASISGKLPDVVRVVQVVQIHMPFGLVGFGVEIEFVPASVQRLRFLIFLIYSERF
jgi:hypothetical protein